MSVKALPRTPSSAAPKSSLAATSAENAAALQKHVLLGRLGSDAT